MFRSEVIVRSKDFVKKFFQKVFKIVFKETIYYKRSDERRTDNVAYPFIEWKLFSGIPVSSIELYISASMSDILLLYDPPFRIDNML